MREFGTTLTSRNWGSIEYYPFLYGRGGDEYFRDHRLGNGDGGYYIGGVFRQRYYPHQLIQYWR